MEFRRWLEYQAVQTPITGPATGNVNIAANPRLASQTARQPPPQEDAENTSKIEKLLQTAKKVEEYGFGAVKFGKNMAAIPRTVIDALRAAKAYQQARKSGDQQAITVAKEGALAQMRNMAKLPVGGVLSGLPYVGLKAAAFVAHTPAFVVGAIIAASVYYLAYYTMTIASDLSQRPDADRAVIKWLVKLGRSLSKLMPDRMRSVMMPGQQESAWAEIDELLLFENRP